MSGDELRRGQVVEVFAPGRARTKGSMVPEVSRGPGGKLRVHLVESGEYSVKWKRTMILAIWKTCGIEPLRSGRKIVGFNPAPFDGAVRVNAVFMFEREHGVGGELLPSHCTPWPTDGKIGDEDKLRRNLLDALTQSGMIADDRLVVGTSRMLPNEKRWTKPGETAGVRFWVGPA